MKEWKLRKCFRAFNTVHGKLPPLRLAPYPNPNPNLGGFAGGNLPLGNFSGGWQFFDHDGKFTGDNFPVTI